MKYVLDGLRNGTGLIVMARFLPEEKHKTRHFHWQIIYETDYVDLPMSREAANSLRLGETYTIEVKPA